MQKKARFYSTPISSNPTSLNPISLNRISKPVTPQVVCMRGWGLSGLLAAASLLSLLLSLLFTAASPDRAAALPRVASTPVISIAGASGASGVVSPVPVDYISITPSGPYKTVSKGKSGSIQWRLERAPGNKNTTCWRMVTTPKAKAAAGNAPGNARCYPPIAADTEIVDVPRVVASNAPRSKVGFVAIVVPKGTRSVRVGQIGGKFTTIAGGKSIKGPIVFVGKKTPLWVDMTLPGKRRLACQGGVLIDKYDLKDPILTGPSVGAAWFCDEL